MDDIQQTLDVGTKEGTISADKFTKQTKSGNSTADFKASQGVQLQEVVDVKDLNKGLNQIIYSSMS